MDKMIIMDYVNKDVYIKVYNLFNKVYKKLIIILKNI